MYVQPVVRIESKPDVLVGGGAFENQPMLGSQTDFGRDFGRFYRGADNPQNNNAGLITPPKTQFDQSVKSIYD